MVHLVGKADDAKFSDKIHTLSPERKALLAQLLKKKETETPSGEPAPSGLPLATPNRDELYKPFPLTKLQQAYWIGRNGFFEMSHVASHSYVEVENENLDLPRLEQAWNRLIERHEMLRAVIQPDGQQQILERVPLYSFALTDLRGVSPEREAAELDAVRYRLSHNVLPSDQWPLFEIRASRLGETRYRLHISLDSLVFDGWSIALMFREWAALYRDPAAEWETSAISFRDYVFAELALEETEEYKRSRDYWRRRVPDLPAAPDLPLAQSPSAMSSGRFVRRRGRVEPVTWTRLKDRVREHGLTGTGVLLSAYAEVLALWSGGDRFCVNVPSFNRFPLHPHVNRLIGEFASFSVLEVDNTGSDSFLARAKRHQQQLWEDLDFRYYNGVEVLRDLAQSRNQTSGSLMPVVFTASAQDEKGQDAYTTLAAEAVGTFVFAVNQTSQVWLDNHVSEQKGALVCDWDTVEELFPPGLSEAMFEAYLRLLHRLAEDETAWHQTKEELSAFLLPPEQARRRQTDAEGNRNVAENRIQDAFVSQAKRRPDQKALVSSQRTLTFRQLYELSNQWGHRLRELGAKPNQLIAVVMEKGWEQAVAVLGILQAGAAYVPIDPAVPKERLAYLLGHSGVSIALTQSRLDETLDWPGHVERFAVDKENLASWPVEPLVPVQTPDDLAFVIYTSGSTGLPKGVMLAHRGAVNCLAHTQRHFSIGPEDRVLAVTALHHDMSVFDLFGVLGAGGTVVIPDSAERRDPANWSEWMKRERVTLWNSVPAMMEMLLEYASENQEAVPPSLRTVFLGGDWIPLTLPQRLRALVPEAKVVSVGGPTETTLWNIWYEVDTVSPDWKSIPYGKPIAHTRYRVLNERLEDCPDWVPGELCCSGVGLAKGYWNDPEKTEAKFIRHPRTGERLCRTGDRGRFLPDGNIEFLGRTDFQVKIQGQRIELGEIEAALQQHAAVRQAVVSAVGDPQGKKRLVGYWIPQNGAVPSADELQTFLQAKLPPYMIPFAFVTVEAFPLTRNGKVDRKALPVPDLSAETSATKPSEPVSSETSDAAIARIRSIVAAVLEVIDPDPDKNLLSLGANSIDMVRIGNELGKEFGERPRIEQIFRLQTIRALAGFYDRAEEKAPTGQDITLAAHSPEIQTLLNSYKVMIEPCQRDEFKKSRPGIRRRDGDKPSIPLIAPPLTEAEKTRYRNRRSHRTFSLKPIAFGSFSEFLGCLRQIPLDGSAKAQYGSPGGLNPMQVYLHVKAGRIEGVPAGIYYYHPEEHRLVVLSESGAVDRNIHIPFINQPIFDEAAFSVYLIASLDAIAPSYGERSIHFLTLEAGIVAHHLEMNAHNHGIGLCQIGSIEFERIRPMFDLTDRHILFHSMLGGRIDPDGASAGVGVSCAAASEPLDKAASLARKIKQLTPEEVRRLLEANRKTDTTQTQEKTNRP